MGLVEFITKLFGNKAQKDMREIMPYVDQIKAVYDMLDNPKHNFTIGIVDDVTNLSLEEKEVNIKTGKETLN